VGHSFIQPIIQVAGVPNDYAPFAPSRAALLVACRSASSRVVCRVWFPGPCLAGRLRGSSPFGWAMGAQPESCAGRGQVPPGGPGPVRDHGHGGGEDGGTDCDEGDLPAGHAADDHRVGSGCRRRGRAVQAAGRRPQAGGKRRAPMRQPGSMPYRSRMPSSQGSVKKASVAACVCHR